MQPTRQDLIPFRFYSGEVTSSPLTIDLNAAYDHVIAWLSLGAGGVSSSGKYALLGDAENAELWATEVNGDAEGNYALQQPLWIVVQQLGSLTFTTNVSDPNLGIYGWRLNPPGATLLP